VYLDTPTDAFQPYVRAWAADLSVADDPATSYQSSAALSHELARARLLTIDGYGHTEQANPSTCATDYGIRYLLTGALPPAGTVCPQNGTPFPATTG
jgi:hypothetical protein